MTNSNIKKISHLPEAISAQLSDSCRMKNGVLIRIYRSAIGLSIDHGLAINPS